MKFANPMRALLLGGILVAVAAGALATGALRTTPTQAGVVANEYSMGAAITPLQANLATNFTVVVSIDHSFTPADCTDGTTNGIDDDGDTVIDNPGENGLGAPLSPTPAGCYQGAQWEIDYNESLVSVVSMIQPGSAPAECAFENNNGSRLLLSCVSTTGAIMSYSGTTWNVTLTCNVAGFAFFTMTTSAAPGETTFVSDGIDNLPMHVHGDSIECGTGGPTATNTPGPTSTPTTFPTATHTATPANTATPCTGTCPTAVPTPTVHPRNTDTPIPDATDTPEPATPASGETPGAPAATSTRTGAGGPGGVLIGPDTGSGPGSGTAGLLWVWLAVGAAGTALAAAGAYGQWRTGRR